MKNTLSYYLDKVILFLLFAVAGVTPLLFFNQTTEFYEMPKLVVLIVATIVLLGLWIFSWIVKGKVVINRTPLDIPLLVLLVVILVSTYFSATRFPAVYGVFPRVHGSAVSLIAYILLYFVAASQLKNIANIKNLFYVLFGSGVVVSVITLASFFKLFLPLDFAKAVNFTPTGSSFSTAAFLLMLLPLPVLSLVKQNKYLPLPVALALSILFAGVVALIGSIWVDVLLVLVFAGIAFIAKPHQVKKTLGVFLVPVATTALILVLAYVPFPGNILQSLEVNFPKEIQLTLPVSWKVSASAFRDAPFIGTGPSTYLFNFTTYKPVEFNQQNVWSFSFDTAYNEFLQVLGTLGFFGFLGLVVLSLVVIANAWRITTANAANQTQDVSRVLTIGLAVSGLVAIALLLIHATTLVSLVVALLVWAAFMMSQEHVREKVLEFSIGIKALTAENRQFDLFPIVVFIVYLIAAVPVLYKTANVVLADYYHRLALSQANTNGTLTYQYLQKAESLNPEVDLYRVDMAQTNFALANALALQKGPTKDNPQGTLTDNDKKTIQTLLSQSINEGRVAVVLSPRSARNWEVLASIYKNITGVAQNALSFSLDAYSAAIQRDPLNPALRLNVGGIYYAAKNYELATRFFTDSINLKPDYANAYYNLSLAYKDKGELQNAALVANQLVILLQKNNPNSADLKAAQKYFNDLKDLITSNTQAQQQEQEANQAAGLQNNNIQGVNVNNLQNAPKVNNPAPVKSNPSANIPQLTPTPTAAPVK
jgi:tetratricopeptide (TPR) repeat protein